MTDVPRLRPLVETLRAVAAELAELASIADHLESITPSVSGRLDGAWIERCQFADLLTQRLAGLTGFVDAAAATAPLDALLEVGAALDGLKLAEQARRLSGRPPLVAVPAARSGEFFLFGE